jgi:hypothetical protein
VADAPAWLREAFRDGVDDREMVYRDGVERFRAKGRPYAGANPWCWLAQFDPKRLPCAGQPGKVIERFHFIGRQRVEKALGALLPDYTEAIAAGDVEPGGAVDFIDWQTMLTDVILVAAWDSRNAGLGCEHHHRRFDNHAHSPAAPAIKVPAFALPEHVDDFVIDLGLEHVAEERFEDYDPDGDRAYLQPGR